MKKLLLALFALVSLNVVATGDQYSLASYKSSNRSVNGSDADFHLYERMQD